MSNISELIASLLARSTTEGLMAEEYGANNRRVIKAEAATDTATAAIVDPWNAAYDAMKDAAKFAYSSGYTFCRVCRLTKVAGHEDWCFIGKLQAALALMEGNSHSHSRDEAMVEDKGYERDDIYKK